MNEGKNKDTGPAKTAYGYESGDKTKPPDWHWLVVSDMVFNALATGLFLAAAAGDLLRPDLFALAARLAYPVALVLLLIDLSCLVLDLGDPLRFHHMLRVFKPSSPMSLGTWCLTAYSFPLTAVVAIDLCIGYDLLPADSVALSWVRTAAVVAGLLPALGSAVYKGVLFSTSSQPGWQDGRWLGAYHANSAVLLGGAGLLVIAVLAGDGPAAAALRPAVGLLAVLNLIPLGLLAAELRPTVADRYSPLWVEAVAAAAVGCGLVPVGLLAAGGRPALLAGAAAVVLLGAIVTRTVIVWLPHAAPRSAS